MELTTNAKQPKHSRDEVLRAIRKTGRRAWKVQAEYHIRSLAETTMHRIKAVFGSRQIDAVDDYIRGGGGAMFISDANFGSDRGDAQQSDQQFLDRFGVLVNEDRVTHQLNRGDGASRFEEFRDPNSPRLEGVDTFDGEGVSPFTVPADLSTLPPDVTVRIVAGVPDGQQDRLSPSCRGLPLRKAAR